MELMKIFLPAILVFFTAFIFFEKTQKRKLSTPKPEPADNQKTKIFLPLKLKAYERLIIFLERMKPSRLIMRINDSSFNSSQLQIECLRNIREEFEHNLSMQMYISEKSWLHIKAAKEETLELIKIAGSKVAPGGSNMDLAKAVFELESETKNAHIDLAINMLKAEVRALN